MTLVHTQLTILMPCLNEAGTLRICIRKAKIYLNNSGLSGEIIVADNGSTDGSLAIAAEEQVCIVHAPLKGYGNALLAGFSAAKGTYIIMADADDSYDFTDLSPYVSGLEAGNDLVIGNRYKGGIEHGAMPWLHRYLGTPVLSAIGRFFFRTDIRDFNCGLRGISKAAFNNLDLKMPGMEFASEMIIKAALKECAIIEVPARLYSDAVGRKPHLRTWRDGWRILRFMLLHCPRWLFLYPGLFLILIGLFAGFMPARQFNMPGIICSMLGFQLSFFYLIGRFHSGQSGVYPLKLWQERLTAFLISPLGATTGLLVMLLGIIPALLTLDSISGASSVNSAIIFPTGFVILSGFYILVSTLVLNVFVVMKRSR